MESSTYVLVHGAWGGPWCWRDVTAELDRRGLAWRSADLPSCQRDGDPYADLDQDAAVVAELCEGLDSVVLVAHSYGGAVATQAAHLIGELARVIYVAAIVPELGESATDVARLIDVRTDLDRAMRLEGPVLYLDAELAGSALYGDCEAATRDWAVSQLSTQTLASFRSPRTGSVVPAPTLYVACLQDRAIDPSLQDILAARCNARVDLESGHSPFFSHPTQLVDVLTQ